MRLPLAFAEDLDRQLAQVGHVVGGRLGLLLEEEPGVSEPVGALEATVLNGRLTRLVEDSLHGLGSGPEGQSHLFVLLLLLGGVALTAFALALGVLASVRCGGARRRRLPGGGTRGVDPDTAEAMAESPEGVGSTVSLSGLGSRVGFASTVCDVVARPSGGLTPGVSWFTAATGCPGRGSPGMVVLLSPMTSMRPDSSEEEAFSASILNERLRRKIP